MGPQAGRQGTGVLAGDAEHKNYNTNSKAILLDVGSLTDQETKAQRGQELARRHAANQKAAGNSRQASLEGWGVRGSFLGMDLKAGDPRGCLVVRLGKTQAQLDGKGRPSLQRTGSSAPAPGCGGGGAGWGSVWLSRFSSLPGHCEEALALLPLGCCGFLGQLLS